MSERRLSLIEREQDELRERLTRLEERVAAIGRCPKGDLACHTNDHARCAPVEKERK